MNIRCTLAAGIAAFVVAIAALFAAPAAATAQAVDCSRCDHFTFSVAADVACPISICYSLVAGDPDLCRSVQPGQSVSIPCSATRVWVLTCSGPHYIIPADATSPCTGILKFASACCGRICTAPSIDLCTHLQVQAAPCLSIGCP
ncbi:MAG TPA: hypothetical protein VHI13_20015 [Candidatus Kapabacteria bacterium]|nr:hypothetical protein [Candidatus Kapabacteria bacterium]